MDGLSLVSSMMDIGKDVGLSFLNQKNYQENMTYNNYLQQEAWNNMFSMQNRRQDELNLHGTAMEKQGLLNAGLNPILAMSGSNFSGNVANPSSPGVSGGAIPAATGASFLDAIKTGANIDLINSQVDLNEANAEALRRKTPSEVNKLDSETAINDLTAKMKKLEFDRETAYDAYLKEQGYVNKGSLEARKSLVDYAKQNKEYDVYLHQAEELIRTADLNALVAGQKALDPTVINAMVKMDQALYDRLLQDTAVMVATVREINSRIPLNEALTNKAMSEIELNNARKNLVNLEKIMQEWNFMLNQQTDERVAIVNEAKKNGYDSPAAFVFTNLMKNLALTEAQIDELGERADYWKHAIYQGWVNTGVNALRSVIETIEKVIPNVRRFPVGFNTGNYTGNTSIKNEGPTQSPFTVGGFTLKPDNKPIFNLMDK